MVKHDVSPSSDQCFACLRFIVTASVAIRCLFGALASLHVQMPSFPGRCICWIDGFKRVGCMAAYGISKLYNLDVEWTEFRSCFFLLIFGFTWNEVSMF